MTAPLLDGLKHGQVLEAHLLRPGDRIGCRGSDWMVDRVAVTHDAPVVVTARRLTSGMPGLVPEDLTMPAAELVRVRP